MLPISNSKIVNCNFKIDNWNLCFILVQDASLSIEKRNLPLATWILLQKE